MSKPTITDHKILTDSKILSMIKSKEKEDNVKLLETKLEPGTVAGDNYSSQLVNCYVKAKVGGVTKEYHWMVKMPPAGEHQAKMGREMRVEFKEIQVYSELIPALRQMIQEKKAAFDINACPLYYSEYNDSLEEGGSILAMEHLKHLGYEEPPNKKKGLSLKHTLLAVSELARFHAATHAYFKSFPGGLNEGLEKYSDLSRDYLLFKQADSMKKILGEMEKASEEMSIDLLASIQEEGQNLVGQYTSFLEKVGGIKEVRDKLRGPEEGGFNVLCHGDAWFNNMLFKHEDTAEGKVPTKVCLVDLALTMWSSPCTDLSYFIFISVAPNLRKTHMDQILGTYHDTLMTSLHQLKIDPSIYPYRQFMKDFQKRSICGFLMSLWVLPLVLAKKEDAIDQSEFNVDFEDQKKKDEAMEIMKERTKLIFQQEPEVKIRIGGNYMEMVERGFFKF